MKNNLRTIIKNLLNEHATNVRDKEIYSLISPQEQKELYRLVVNRKTDELKIKMSFLVEKLKEYIGEEKENYIKDFLKRMIYKMYLSRNK